MHENVIRLNACALAKKASAAELLSQKEKFQAVAPVHRVHVFKDIWEAGLSEELMCERKSHSQQNCYVKCSL